jgi:hypothetical protein
MASAGDLDDLGGRAVLELLAVGSLRGGSRHGVVLLTGDQEHRPPFRVLGVDLGLGAGVEVGAGSLEERCPGARYGEGLVALLGFVLTDGVGKGVAELLVGARPGPG